MSQTIRIKDVRPLDDLILSVLFADGTHKRYDVKQLLDGYDGMFLPLRDDPSLFRCVRVDCGGCGVAWNADIDISEYELWENGVEETDV